jgi:adenine-specific DNA-methyltransferase
MSPPGKKSKSQPVPVEALEHDERRLNIPTEELRDFVAADEETPAKMLYPRDPSLDPQLVWKGKDKQDAEDLAVPTVPIYIQETVRPQALIENLRATAAAGEQEPELTLFEDIRTLEFEEMVDFYNHPDRWSNRLILGDSLLVMNSLAEKEKLRGKVQTIYIDPPYGIKFKSNWQVSTRRRDVRDGKVEDATRQPEQIRAFRDTWELGIHSYLSYLRDRLSVSRELLADSGSCFVQIGDENMHLVRSLMDEVFGAENFVAVIAFSKTTGLEATEQIASRLDYLVWYAHDKAQLKYRPLFEKKDPQEAGFGRVELLDGTRRAATKEEREGTLPEGARLFMADNLTKPGPGAKYDVEFDGNTFDSGSRWWGTPKESMERLIANNRTVVAGNTLRYVRYYDDFPLRAIGNLWDGIGGAPNPVYVVQTNLEVVKRCLLMTSDPGDLVLDPTCGSGTTALCAEQYGRRWITIDTSRVSVALARTRLMTARLPAYLLVDSTEGRRKESELSAQPPATTEVRRSVRKGFVYRRIPHVTLRSIANNPDIREGMPREEIEAAIARHADQELLYDQPYENPKTVRVPGTFTVESLSPHRMLDHNPDLIAESEDGKEGAAPFATTILENLRKAGVQNTVRDEHLDFDMLEAFPGRFVHMRGDFTDKDGETRSIAVSLGPEHGTVGADQINEAAKEAMKGAGADLLLVCAFAFDAHAGEEAKEFAPDASSNGGGDWAMAAEERQLGKLPVLLVRMNPDLAMGDELLKKTGSGNLFMVFGEPDVVIERVGDDEVDVEIRGVDIYDPTTGAIRSNSTDDIACWFIDTNYNAESFFVRHAYFTGADKPYERVQRALRADIDEEAWQSLYRTRSRPFPLPESGRIAVKVINHYGDEVLKTYEV